jgi:hypothetical protein
MADIFERFAEHVYNKHEHTAIIDLIWEDPDFPWRNVDAMSEFVHDMYSTRHSAEFDILFDHFDASMTCSSSSDTTETEEWLDSDNEEYSKWNTSENEVSLGQV